jgi:hypothetical protein
MEYIQEHSFYILLIFIGVLLIFDSITSYRNKGVSSQSYRSRLQGILITSMISLTLLLFFFQMNMQKEVLVGFLGPLLFSFLTAWKKSNDTVVNVLKYQPTLFFDILESKLDEKGYPYFKESKADEAYLSSNYTTYFYLDDTNEEIKINWKDLDTSNILVSFPKFRDKILIKELMQELKEQ